MPTLVEQPDLRPMAAVTAVWPTGNVQFKVFGHHRNIAEKIRDYQKAKLPAVWFLCEGKGDQDDYEQCLCLNDQLIIIQVTPDRELVSRVIKPKIQ